MRVQQHPILGKETRNDYVMITVDGEPIQALKGEPIAAALLAAGIKRFRHTPKKNMPRGVYCAIGRCTDCVMTVNGVPNVRTCVEPVKDGMTIRTQSGLGKWSDGHE